MTKKPQNGSVEKQADQPNLKLKLDPSIPRQKMTLHGFDASGNEVTETVIVPLTPAYRKLIDWLNRHM